MAFTLNDVKSSKTKQNLRILMYGPPGIGKTTFASMFPAPILLRTEDGAAGLDIQTFDLIKNLKDLSEALHTLRNEKHDFKTLILDSLDWLEPLVWEKVIKDNKIKSIEDLGYGKGYVYALEIWKQIITGVELTRAKGMNIIAISHATTNSYDPPDGQSYVRSELKLNKKAAALWYEWSDIIAYMRPVVNTKTDATTKKTKAVSGGEREVCFNSHPAFVAKSRIPLEESYIVNDIKEYKNIVKEICHD